MIMLLTTRDNEAIAAAQTYYEGRYDESLIDKVILHTPDPPSEKSMWPQTVTPPTRKLTTREQH